MPKIITCLLPYGRIGSTKTISGFPDTFAYVLVLMDPRYRVIVRRHVLTCLSRTSARFNDRFQLLGHHIVDPDLPATSMMFAFHAPAVQKPRLFSLGAPRILKTKTLNPKFQIPNLKPSSDVPALHFLEVHG